MLNSAGILLSIFHIVHLEVRIDTEIKLIVLAPSVSSVVE